jgi:hypothetical protein
MRFGDLRFGQFRKALEEEWSNFACPKQIYDFFMRQHGVSERNTAEQCHTQEKCRYADAAPAPAA